MVRPAVLQRSGIAKEECSSYMLPENTSKTTSSKKPYCFTSPVWRYKKIYYILVSEKTDEKSFTKTLTILDNYFISKANFHFKRYKFHLIARTRENSIDDSMCKQRQAAATCEFGYDIDKRLPDQIISIYFSNSLRRNFLEKETLTLQNVVNMAKKHGTVNSQLQAIGSAFKPCGARCSSERNCPFFVHGRSERQRMLHHW